jgi:hypothetical protein
MEPQAAAGAGVKRTTVASLVWLAVASASCSAADGGPAATTTGGSGAVADPPKNPLGRPRCQAPAGVSARPRDTQEAVALLNALPKPTSVACFIESLARPLSIQATSSVFSAQPALSAASPRVFVRLGQSWLSMVVDGSSSTLLEFGDIVADEPTRSIKGELELPVQAAVAPSAPYDRVLFSETGTTCGFCHYDERRADNLPFPQAYASIAFQPRPDSLVSLASLRAEYQACDWTTEAYRCDLLWSIFGGGEVIELPFSTTLPTFF